MYISNINTIFIFYHPQVLVEVPVKGSVVTWDFDILKYDVTFTVFFCRKSPATKDSETWQPHSHHVPGTPAGVASSTQYIDKSMVVGRDLSIVEPPNICRDGDSVQVHRGIFLYYVFQNIVYCLLHLALVFFL